jgi:putative hemolysin
MDDSIPIILYSIIASFFFSGIEIAFLTANKLKIELESNQGKFQARILSFFIKKPQRFITTTLVGNNTALVIYGIFTAKLLEPYLREITQQDILVILMQTILSTILIVVLAEFLPKSLFRINPNHLLSILALPFLVVYILIYPVVFITVGLAEFIIGLVSGKKVNESELSFGRVDLDNYVKQFTSQGNYNENLDHEIKIFQNALDFSDVKVRECMIPRTEIVAIEVSRSIGELKQKFVDTHLSKILVFEETIDNIIGYVHSSTLFRKPDSIRKMLMPLAMVPETMSAKEIFSMLRNQRRSLAVVVDEFGGLSGMITIEDIMEEIFGEIDDEHDKEDLLEKQLSDSEFLFAARLEIDYLNEVYKLNLPVSDEYETLGGLILYYHGSLPRKNEQIVIKNFRMLITAASHNRIDMVKLTLLEG